MAQICDLIAPVQPILHRVSCTNKTLTNATKHYETHQYMTLGSNGVDQVCSLRKISMRFMFNPFCTKFWVATKQIQNAPKQYETHQYYSLGSNGADRVCLMQKIPMRLHGTKIRCNFVPRTFHLCSTHFAPSFV